jgi:hypothetical protein
MSIKECAAYEEPAARSRTYTYVAVVAVEALVIAALWLFGRYFSS